MVYTTGIVKKGLSIPPKTASLLTYRLNGIVGIVLLYTEYQFRQNRRVINGLIGYSYIEKYYTTYAGDLQSQQRRAFTWNLIVCRVLCRVCHL